MTSPLNKFNIALGALLTLVEKNSRTDTEVGLVLKVKNMISIARAADEQAPIRGFIEQLPQYNDHITSRSDEFIAKATPYEIEVASQPITDDVKMFLQLIAAVRVVYARTTNTDRKRAWDLLTDMRDSAIDHAVG